MKRYYSHFAKFDTWLKVGFEGDEITLDVPEDGTIQELQQGWKITPRSTPVVSLYCTQFCMCLPELPACVLEVISVVCSLTFLNLVQSSIDL